MIVYKDFLPEEIQAPGFMKSGKHANFDSAVLAANAWLEEHSVTLISLETVVLPNIWNSREQGSEDGSLTSYGEGVSRWHQFVRVWYRES